MQHDDTHELGRIAALRGYSIQAPSHLRTTSAKKAYEDGWLEGQRERNALLNDMPTIRVAHRIAIPLVVLLSDKRCTVRWKDQGSGLEFQTADLAKQGLQERVARDAELGKFLAKQPLRHASLT